MFVFPTPPAPSTTSLTMIFTGDRFEPVFSFLGSQFISNRSELSIYPVSASEITITISSFKELSSHLHQRLRQWEYHEWNKTLCVGTIDKAYRTLESGNQLKINTPFAISAVLVDFAQVSRFQNVNKAKQRYAGVKLLIFAIKIKIFVSVDRCLELARFCTTIYLVPLFVHF